MLSATDICSTRALGGVGHERRKHDGTARFGGDRGGAPGVHGSLAGLVAGMQKKGRSLAAPPFFDPHLELDQPEKYIWNSSGWVLARYLVTSFIFTSM
jgi:hypothetical protein